MINNWLVEQTTSMVEQWDSSLTTFYPDTQAWMIGPAPYLQRLVVDCNYLNAVKQLDWNKYLTPGAAVLDVGCGGGWLSAYLSTFPQVERILAIDSSINYLQNFLPSVVEQLSGNMSKIDRVQGLFSPILVDSNSIDLVVISSALHHAPSISAVLEEFRRVLKPGGSLIILNETPSGSMRYLYQISKAFIKILIITARQQFKAYAQKISAAGYLYDPYLGDVDYPEWYWEKAILCAGLELVHVHNSGLPTVVNTPDRPLKHFICRKSAS